MTILGVYLDRRDLVFGLLTAPLVTVADLEAIIAENARPAAGVTEVPTTGVGGHSFGER